MVTWSSVDSQSSYSLVFGKHRCPSLAFHAQSWGHRLEGNPHTDADVGYRSEAELGSNPDPSTDLPGDFG